MRASVCVFWLLVMGAGQADTQFELTDENEHWLEENVGALITKDETALFRKVRPEDRELFEEIFWLRRDPDLSTPENEFRRRFELRRSDADERYRMQGRRGSTTEIGRVLLLMGRPDYTDRDDAQSAASGSDGRGGRRQNSQGDNPVTRSGLGGRMAGADRGEDRPGKAQDMSWTYDANTDSRLSEELTLEFRMRPPLGWVLATPDTEEVLASVRQARVANRSIDYLLDDDGVLSRPAELDAFLLSPAQTILLDLRKTQITSSDFEFKPSVSFFHAANGTVYSPLLLEIDSAGWSWEDGAAEAVVFGLLETNEGLVVSEFEQAVTLTRDHTRISVPLQSEPGVYQLLLGLHDASAERVATKVISLPLPGIQADVLSLSTVLMLSSFERGAGTPTIGNAYQFVNLKLEPNADKQYRQDDNLIAFYYIYGFMHGDASEQGELTAQYRFYLDGEPYKQYRVKTLPAQGYQSGDLIEIPLAEFEPGQYQMEILIRDEMADTGTSKMTAFEIQP